jgi:hypothetical protein
MHKFQHAIVVFLTLRSVEVYAHDGLIGPTTVWLRNPEQHK